MSTDSPFTEFPDALAYALPFEGAHIRVFYDRVLRAVEPRLQQNLLAHVLAHEVAHVLQGVSRHSEEGIMKARWGVSDYLQMNWRPMQFTPLDVELIHRGMDVWASRMAKRN